MAEHGDEFVLPLISRGQLQVGVRQLGRSLGDLAFQVVLGLGQSIEGPLPLQRMTNRTLQDIGVDAVFDQVVGGAGPNRFSVDGRIVVSGQENQRSPAPLGEGPADEIERYKRVFGVGEQEALEVVV